MMAMYPNGRHMSRSPGRHFGVAPGLDVYLRGRGDTRSRFASATYSNVLGAVPSGYGKGAWIMAVKSGGMAGFSDMSFTPAATGVLGLPGSGSAEVTFTVADAAGQLISSGSGAASLTFTVADALLTASLGGSGSAALAFSTNNALLGAIASLTASGSFTITGTLTPYAIGQMAGSTVDTSVLTVDLIAAGVLAAALTSPIAANIKRVNDVTVNGTGSTGDEWGP